MMVVYEHGTKMEERASIAPHVGATKVKQKRVLFGRISPVCMSPVTRYQGDRGIHDHSLCCDHTPPTPFDITAASHMRQCKRSAQSDTNATLITRYCPHFNTKRHGDYLFFLWARSLPNERLEGK